ncbi:uncharacterized protein [Ptychodera flava]|uniref:uncharacterized protein n=1 Tax=Ptychodera flava TaxID=63121 RepID=UPI003969C229
MFRLMMAGRSYANVPTSDSPDKHKNSHIPLAEISSHRSANMAAQGLTNGSIPTSQESTMAPYPPETPPRNPTSNPTYNPHFQSQGMPLETIPQSPDYMKDKDNPYEELPHNFPPPPPGIEYVQYHGIDEEEPKLYSSQPADPKFVRLDSTFSSTSTDGIIKSSSSERGPRKKKNPTYEETPFSQQLHHNQLSKEEEANQPSHHRSCECFKTYFFIILIFMLALLALLLVVLVISGTLQTGTSPGQSDRQIGDRTTAVPGPTTEQLQYQITQLENANQALLDRVVEMERLLGLGSDNATISLRLARNTMKIEQLTKNLTIQGEEVDELQNDVQVATLIATGNRNDLANLETKTTETDSNLEQVTNKVVNLTQQVTSTDSMHTQQITELQDESGQHATKINGLEVQINNSLIEFTTMLMTMNQSIYDELDVISKMPGPRGYNGSQGEKGDPGRDGAGNLTLCEYQRYQGGGGFGSTTTTAWIGSETKIVTGVSCSTDGGVTETLEERDDKGYNEYRCACSGGSGPGTRFCYMDMWRCPVNI